MELKPAPPLRVPAPMPLERPADAQALKRAATGFEALLLARLLAAASRPSPFAGALSAGSAEVRSETSRLIGQHLAEAAPLGLEALIARAAQPHEQAP